MYRLNDEQQAIVEQVRRVADEHLSPHAATVDAEGRFPSEAIQALGDAKLLGLTIPTEFSGMGQGLRVAAAALDEIGQRCASTGMIYLMHLCGCACYAASPHVARDAMREAAAGKHLSTLAWSERGSRSHFWAPVSQATRQNGRVVLNAEKSWVTSAGEADGYVVSTRTAGGEKPMDSVLYFVKRDDAGVSVAGPWNALGMRGNASAPMTLRDCAIDADRALCAEGEGFNTMIGVVLPWFQLGNAAISIGISEAATTATQSHLTAKRFEHLNSPLSELPNLRGRLAQMRIETDKARAHLASAIDAAESGSPSAMLLVLESKAAAADTALRVTDLGMQTCGGAAFSRHLSLERNFRDARAAVVMAPTTDVIHDFIGRALCGMELF